MYTVRAAMAGRWPPGTRCLIPTLGKNDWQTKATNHKKIQKIENWTRVLKLGGKSLAFVDHWKNARPTARTNGTPHFAGFGNNSAPSSLRVKVLVAGQPVLALQQLAQLLHHAIATITCQFEKCCVSKRKLPTVHDSRLFGADTTSSKQHHSNVID